MKIALITDPSEAMIGFKRDLLVDSWEIEPVFQKIDKISEAGEVSLFGDAPISILVLDSNEKVKEMVKTLGEISPDMLKARAQFGLIIESSEALNVLSPLRKVCEKLGIPMLNNLSNTGKAKDPNLVANELLEDTNLSRDVKMFLLDYVGPDYDILIPIIRSVMKTNPQGQKKITVDDMQIRLTKEKATVVPWEIDNFLMKGNLTGALEALRRYPASSYLIVLSVMKKKFVSAYRCSVVLDQKPKSNRAELSKSLKIPDTFALQKSMEIARKHGSVNLQKICECLSDTEDKMKGLLSAYPHVIMELAILRVYDLLRD